MPCFRDPQRRAPDSVTGVVSSRRLPLVLLPIMSKVIDGYKIYMPTAASKFPYIPDIPNEHLPRPLIPSTQTGHGSTSTKRRRIKEVSAVNQEKEKFRNDPGCFVTGMSDLTLQATHIVNADQSDPSRLANVVSSFTSRQNSFSPRPLASYPHRCAHYYTQSWIVYAGKLRELLSSYDVSHFCSLLTVCLTGDTVSPSLHTHLDLYATYVITLSKESLKEVVKILEQANKVWDYAVDELGQKKTPRTITVRSSCPIAVESCAVTTVISSVGEPRPNRREYLASDSRIRHVSDSLWSFLISCI